MSNFLIGSALGGLVVVCVALPFVGPWSIRVRYLATAPLVDPWLGLGAPRFQMLMVTLVGVEAHDGRVALTVDEPARGRDAPPAMFTRAACSPRVVAELDGWSALRTPLLMVIDEEGRTHLHGPRTSVSDLVPTGSVVR